MRKITIYHSLVVSYLFLGTIIVVILSLFYYSTLKTALTERVFAHLSSINQLKKHWVENYYKIDKQNITKILYERAGMGETGETYLVADNLEMKSHSRFFPSDSVNKIMANPVVRVTFETGSHQGIVKDYRNKLVYHVSRKLSLEGLNWIIVSEIDEEEILLLFKDVFLQLIWLTLSLGVFIAIFIFYLAKKISTPILKLGQAIQELAVGRLPEKINFSNNNYEIQQMTFALQSLADAMKIRADFANKIGNGDFSGDFKPLSPEDVHGISLLQMRDRLLEARLVQENNRKQCSLALLEGQEQERKRIAQELHDGIGQMLTALRFRLDLITDLDIKQDCKAIIDEIIAETRRISNNLMPSILLHFGLEAALKKLVATTQSTGIACELKYTETQDIIPDMHIDVSLFRVAQEAINNSIKHAKATHITLSVTKQYDQTTMSISDNGIGFSADEVTHKGYGLKNMVERINMLDGEIQIVSTPQKGTFITITIPNK
jgi:signal transduction histidine kinase